MNIISLLCFFGIPAAVLVGFIVSLIKYKKCPPEFTDKKMKWRIAMIITGIVSLVFIVLILALMALLTLIAANM